MLYSRPKIEPLGWDLVDLPIPNGSRNFDGLTSDGHPVDFRFSSGWLTVERGAAGDRETVLSVPISPFGVMDIYPEQLCDILGLTVQGGKVDLSAISPLDRGFDWSGRTTYWHSTHRMMRRGDAEALATEISRAFPDSAMVQPSWETSALKLRCRRIEYLMESGAMVTIGIGFDPARLERMLAAEETTTDEFESVFAHAIEIMRTDQGEDLTGKDYIVAYGAGKLSLDYDVLPQRQYQIRTQYLTDDAEGQSITQKLSAIIDGYFHRGFQIVNLQTGAIVGEDLTDEEDTKSYSKGMRDWCLEKPGRYLSVGISEEKRDGDSPVFIGMRPASNAKR